MLRLNVVPAGLVAVYHKLTSRYLQSSIHTLGGDEHLCRTMLFKVGQKQIGEVTEVAVALYSSSKL